MSRAFPPGSSAKPPPALATSGGIAIGRAAGRAQVTALVLSLRRRTEADAQEALAQVRLQLELARQAEAAAAQLLTQAEHECQRLRIVQTGQTGPGPAQAIPAAQLANQSAQLGQTQKLVRDRQHQRDAQAAQVQTLLQLQGELHTALRLALARREAAELHQTEERREHKRLKAQRQRNLEEEVRDRFLSAQRQAKPPRR